LGKRRKEVKRPTGSRTVVSLRKPKGTGEKEAQDTNIDPEEINRNAQLAIHGEKSKAKHGPTAIRSSSWSDWSPITRHFRGKKAY